MATYSNYFIIIHNNSTHTDYTSHSYLHLHLLFTHLIHILISSDLHGRLNCPQLLVSDTTKTHYGVKKVTLWDSDFLSFEKWRMLRRKWIPNLNLSHHLKRCLSVLSLLDVLHFEIPKKCWRGKLFLKTQFGIKNRVFYWVQIHGKSSKKFTPKAKSHKLWWSETKVEILLFSPFLKKTFLGELLRNIFNGFEFCLKYNFFKPLLNVTFFVLSSYFEFECIVHAPKMAENTFINESYN